MTLQDIVANYVLRMKEEADNLHMTALVTALHVRLRLLDVAGSEASIVTIEPGPCNGEAVVPGSVAAASGNPLQCWLIHEPGHCEVLCPAEAYQNIERLPNTSMTLSGSHQDIDTAHRGVKNA